MENNLIVKSNQLIEARYNLSLNEQKLLLYSISKLEKDIEDITTVSLNINDFIGLVDINGKQYDYIRDIARNLRKKELFIKVDNKEIAMGWFSKVKAEPLTGDIEIYFDNELIPFLLHLKERFTRYQLKNILHLKNKYSIRVYELLKQYESIGKREFALEDLRELLMIDDKYSEFKDLNKYVLDKTVKEINKYTDLEVSYEKVKKGRRVVAIEYFIENKEEKTNKQLEAIYNIPQLKRDCDLDSEKWSSKQIIELYETAVDKAEDIDVYKYIKINYKKMLENKSARNKFAYLKKSLEEDFAKAYDQIKAQYLI